MDSPKVLYKYTSAKIAEEILSSCKIKLSSPRMFNDPFELEPRSIEPPDFETQVKPLIKELSYYKINKDKYRFKGTFDEWSRKIDEDKDFANEVAKSDCEKGIDNVRKKWRQSKGRHGITCFSEAKDNILMWAHYADCHQGVCIGLNVNKLVDDPEQKLSKVKYSSERVILPLGLDNDHGGAIIDELIRTKSNHWSYEHEWRLICLDPEETDYFYSFDGGKDTFAEVILGCKICRDHKLKIIKRVNEINSNKPKNSHPVKLFEANIHKTEYGLTFSETGI